MFFIFEFRRTADITEKDLLKDIVRVGLVTDISPCKPIHGVCVLANDRFLINCSERQLIFHPENLLSHLIPCKSA